MQKLAKKQPVHTRARTSLAFVVVLFSMLAGLLFASPASAHEQTESVMVSEGYSYTEQYIISEGYYETQTITTSEAYSYEEEYVVTPGYTYEETVTLTDAYTYEESYVVEEAYSYEEEYVAVAGYSYEEEYIVTPASSYEEEYEVEAAYSYEEDYVITPATTRTETETITGNLSNVNCPSGYEAYYSTNYAKNSCRQYSACEKLPNPSGAGWTATNPNGQAPGGFWAAECRTYIQNTVTAERIYYGSSIMFDAGFGEGAFPTCVPELGGPGGELEGTLCFSGYVFEQQVPCPSGWYTLSAGEVWIDVDWLTMASTTICWKDSTGGYSYGNPVSCTISGYSCTLSNTNAPIGTRTVTIDVPAVMGTRTVDVPAVMGTRTVEVPAVTDTRIVDVDPVMETRTVEVDAVIGTRTVEVPAVTDSQTVVVEDVMGTRTVNVPAGTSEVDVWIPAVYGEREIVVEAVYEDQPVAHEHEAEPTPEPVLPTDECDLEDPMQDCESIVDVNGNEIVIGDGVNNGDENVTGPDGDCRLSFDCDNGGITDYDELYSNPFGDNFPQDITDPSDDVRDEEAPVDPDPAPTCDVEVATDDCDEDGVPNGEENVRFTDENGNVTDCRLAVDCDKGGVTDYDELQRNPQTDITDPSDDVEAVAATDGECDIRYGLFGDSKFIQNSWYLFPADTCDTGLVKWLGGSNFIAAVLDIIWLILEVAAIRFIYKRVRVLLAKEEEEEAEEATNES